MMMIRCVLLDHDLKYSHLLRWQEISWLVDDSHSCVTPPLCESSFSRLPSLIAWVKDLDGGQVHDPVVPSHDIQEVVDHASSCIPTRCRHVWKTLPASCCWVKPKWIIIGD